MQRKLIAHCSDSPFGCAVIIDTWHKERFFDCIGYHYVILNGFPYSTKRYFPFLNGSVEVGRPLKRTGAHCRGHNGAIGVCLIGNKQVGFTELQTISLQKIIVSLGISRADVYGHCDFDKNKTCPDFDVGAWGLRYLQ